MESKKVVVNKLQSIPLHQIVLGDRRREDYGHIDKLAASIERIGLLHPVVVKRISDEQFRVVVGGRRLKALQMLKVDVVPTRLIEMLTDEELREIETEENEHRKDFTQAERGRTFKAAQQTVADVKKVAEVLSAKSADKPKPRGHQPKHGVARAEIATTLGTGETSIREAEQHVETAEQFPFMQGDKWREYHVLEARAILQRLDTDEPQRIAEVIEGAGVILHPKDALELLNNLVNNLSKKERAEVYKLSQSEDSRDRDLALTRAAARPPMPDPRLSLLDTVVINLKIAAKLFPADPETGDITATVDIVRNIRKRISKAPQRSAHDTEPTAERLFNQPEDRKEKP